MSKLLAGIIVAMGVSGYMYYQLSIVPMKNEIIELTRVTMAQELRNQEQLDTIEEYHNPSQGVYTPENFIWV